MHIKKNKYKYIYYIYILEEREKCLPVQNKSMFEDRKNNNK